MELGTVTQKKALEDLYSIQPNDTATKIGSIKEIFSESGAAERTKQEIEKYTQKALDGLGSLKVSEKKKSLLRNFGENLMRREV
jgi:geranylgeranyl diphosphate synthase type II